MLKCLHTNAFFFFEKLNFSKMLGSTHIWSRNHVVVIYTITYKNRWTCKVMIARALHER